MARLTYAWLEDAYQRSVICMEILEEVIEPDTMILSKRGFREFLRLIGAQVAPERLWYYKFNAARVRDAHWLLPGEVMFMKNSQILGFERLQ